MTYKVVQFFYMRIRITYYDLKIAVEDSVDLNECTHLMDNELQVIDNVSLVSNANFITSSICYELSIIRT